jgi:hypothetical protein
MFITGQHLYISHHRKSRRRYWWASLAFVIGICVGCGVAHLV